MPDREADRQGGVLTLERHEVRPPPMYKVLLHNDDYTPMDFVTMVLETVFHKPTAEAIKVMLAVHRAGIGLAGIYTRDVAETKVQTVADLARREQHPLKCTMEAE